MAYQWITALSDRLPRFGHRNWIAICDAAYPMQSNQSIETIATGAEHLELLAAVLAEIEKGAPHVRPIIWLDAELSAMTEADTPGVIEIKSALRSRMAGLSTQVLPHEKIIARLDEAARMFNVLILKSTLTLPYTSVFIELECGYWNDTAEKRLRQRMTNEEPHA